MTTRSNGSGGAITACGDDDPQTLTAKDFRDQANQICIVGGDEVHEAFFGVFGDDEPTTDEMEAALTTVMAVSHRQLDDIEALAEPTDMSDEVAAFIRRAYALVVLFFRLARRGSPCIGTNPGTDRDEGPIRMNFLGRRGSKAAVGGRHVAR